MKNFYLICAFILLLFNIIELYYGEDSLNLVYVFLFIILDKLENK